MKNEKLVRRIHQVTQRLDHMVPDEEMSPAANERAANALADLSKRLAELLPDPSLSPDERLERIARVNQDRVPLSEHLTPAAEKLFKLERRLQELVPDAGLTAQQRLESLVAKVSSKAPAQVQSSGSTPSFVKVLESLGDARAGFKPIR